MSRELVVLEGIVGLVLLDLFTAGAEPRNITGPLQQLTDPAARATLDEDPRASAAIEMAAAGAAAVDPLIGALGHRDAEVRRLAAWALGEIGDPRSVAPLAAALADEDALVVRAAAEALGKTGRAAAPALLAALGDRDARARCLAAGALGTVGDRAGADALAAALRDADPSVRAQAAWALGRIREPRTVAALAAALRDEDPNVGRQAGWALGEIGAPAAPSLAALLGEEAVAARAVQALARMGEAAVPPLLPALTGADPPARRRAAEALWRAKARDRRAVAPLVAALGTADAALRGFAAGALGSIGDAQSLDPLATALNDPDPGVRSLSAEALGRIGDALAVAPLAAALNDADASVRRSAAEALGKIGAPAAQALISALGDAGADVRRVAAEGLGGIRDGGAVDALIAALQDAAQPVRMAAATALGKTGDLRAFEPVLNLLVRANGARQTQEFCATNLALERMTGHQNARQIWEGCLDDWNAWWQQAREGDARAQQPEGFQQAYELGRKKCLSPRWWDPADFPGARAALQRSLALAETDEQRAAAHVALGDHWIQDPYPADPAAVRREYAAALALEGATTDQRAQATLGIGETYLREKQYDRARQEFARARGLRSRADWEATVQLALAWSFLQERKLAAARREFARLPGMDGADRIQKWEAQAHLQALRLAPRIRPDHPRLFFDAETWPAVKARALGPERAALAAMERRVAAVSESEIEVGDWGSQAMDAAFVYRVTGDLSAFEKARGMLRATVAHYLRRVDANAHSYSRVACAAALDWMWNDLTPAERRELARGLLQYAYSLYADDRIRGKVDGLAYYYERNIAWYAGLVTFNADLDDVDYARALSLLAWGYSHNKDEVNKYLQASGDDGAGRSALEYYFAETLNTFWQFLHCWRPALGQEVPDSVARFLSPDYILRNVVGVARGRFHHFGYGRSWRSARGMRADLLCDHLAQYVHFFSRSHPQESGMARFLRERMLEAGTVGEGAYSVYPFVLAPEEAPPAGIPRGLPIARHFEYVGQILMSSGFGPDDTYALFSCGGGQNEMDFDATHFTIYRNGYLALDTGSRAHDYQEGYGPRDVSGPNYAFQSVAHNCVLIRMEGEVLPHKTGRPLESNSGGQRKLPREAKLLAFETQPLYAYAATDATPTYHEGKCARMVRQLLFLPPNHFVVFDRVAAKKAEYPKTWLLHTANEPAISGKEFRADQNRGRLFCRTLYPPNAVLEKIGGPGKEFWSDGRNWPIPPDSAYLGSIGMEPGGEVPESIGRWRVEVKPGAARTDDLFLHLIQTADQTVEKMVESRVRDRGDRVELVFTANGRTYALALNKTGAVGGRLRITEGGTVLADRDLTQEVMPQAGLAISR